MQKDERVVGYGLRDSAHDIVTGVVKYKNVVAVVPLANHCLSSEKDFEQWLKKSRASLGVEGVAIVQRLQADGKLLHLVGLGVRSLPREHVWVKWSAFSGGSHGAGRSDRGSKEGSGT